MIILRVESSVVGLTDDVLHCITGGIGAHTLHYSIHLCCHWHTKYAVYCFYFCYLHKPINIIFFACKDNTKISLLQELT